MLPAELDIIAKVLMQRLCGSFPTYPTGGQLCAL
jgi:hypothetical protein